MDKLITCFWTYFSERISFPFISEMEMETVLKTREIEMEMQTEIEMERMSR